MTAQILTAVMIAAAVFVLFTLFQRTYLKEHFETPAAAPPIHFPEPTAPRVIAPSGPNTPAAAPPLERSVEQARLPGPDDSDPYDEKYGSSEVKDNMRYPERMFHKVQSGQDTQIAEASGVASSEAQVTSNAMQTFSPDFAQNGGQFLEGGIFANDTFDNPSYAMV
jgi:hypothetical protein